MNEQDPLVTEGRIEQNDPDLLRLEIGPALYRANTNWARLGGLIGKNTFLRELRVQCCPADVWVSNEAKASFFRGIACNRSITTLYFHHIIPLEGAISVLIPFFEAKHLENLEIRHGCPNVPSLAPALSKFKSLKTFSWSKIHSSGLFANDEGDTNQVLQALASHTGLTSVSLEKRWIGKLGCIALASLISNPDCKLVKLDLGGCKIDDGDAVLLGNAFAENSSLRHLNLGYASYAIAVSGRGTFHMLQGASLVTLSTVAAVINDDVANLLAGVLAQSSSLKALSLDVGGDGITVAGMMAIFSHLGRAEGCLEDTSLTCDWNYNFICTDELAIYLANGLANNSSLKCLRINKILHGITMEGWQAILNILQNTTLALEELNLKGNRISTEVATLLMNSLGNNNALKELYIDSNSALVYEHLRASSPRLLCDQSSITSTFFSNHHLQKLSIEYDDALDEDDEEPVNEAIMDDVECFLQINKKYTKGGAAQMKIIKYHLNYEIDIFTTMEMKLIPHAVAWMAMDIVRNSTETEVAGISLLYQFVRNTPALFATA